MDDTIEVESAQPKEESEQSNEEGAGATTSRRHLFAMGAAAVAGATIADALISGTADAATGGNMVIGAANTVTSASDTTSLTGAFSVTDSEAGIPNRVAITGTQSATSTVPHFGVQGVTHSTFSSLLGNVGGAGVLGV